MRFFKFAERDFPFGSDQDRGNKWYRRELHPSIMASAGGLNIGSGLMDLKLAGQEKIFKIAGWTHILAGATLMALSLYRWNDAKETERSDFVAKYNKEHDTAYGVLHPKMRELWNEYNTKLSNGVEKLSERKDKKRYFPAIAGAAAGIGTAYAIQPLDTIVTKAMSKDPEEYKKWKLEFKGKKWLGESGKLKELYQGVGTKALKVGVASGLSFAAYENILSALNEMDKK